MGHPAPGATPATAVPSDESRRACAAMREQLRAHAVPCVVSIGVFDGLHRGHHDVLATTVRIARRAGLAAVAVTFSPRPESVVRGDEALPDIWPLRERVACLRALGLDDVIVLPFSAAVAAIEWPEVVRLLRTDLGMRTLCVGADFALGHGRAGTIERLAAAGVDVVAVPLAGARQGGEKLSSTRVRRAIAAGVPVSEALDRARAGLAGPQPST
jgi:riboflavin kinase / FMN adenylyltransferase